MIDEPKNPASQKAMMLASDLLDEIAEEPEWEKMMSLIVGNLAGHAFIMIRRHRGEKAAMEWIKMTESVGRSHIEKDPDSQREE